MANAVGSVAAWLRDEHPVPERFRVAQAVVLAVQAAQERGEVFGGLDPAHLELAGDGSCQIREGARRASAASPHAAPEILLGREPSSRSDIFSTGSILYEILTRESVAGQPTVRPPKEVATQVPEELSDATMACLEGDADWRPKDLAYLAALLERFVGAAPAPAASPRAPAPAPRPEPAPLAPVDEAPRPVSAPARPAPAGPAARSSSPLPLIAIVAVLAVAAGAGFWFVKGRGGEGERTPPTTVAAAPVTTPGPAVPDTAPTAAPSAPAARASAEPSPVATPTPLPSAAASSTAAGRPAETPPPALATPPPTPVPAAPTAAPATPPPAPVTAAPAPAVPVVLTAVSPLSLRRPSTTLLDLRGQGLRADLLVRLTRQGGGPDPGLTITRQRLVNPGLLQVLVQVEASAATGPHLVSTVEPDGRQSNALPFQVAK